MNLFQKCILAAGGLIALAIGGALLVAPAAFQASYGTTLPADPSLLSEIRSPGALLIAAGAVMGAALFLPGLTRLALALGAMVYLSYGSGRLVSVALDGWPDSGLIQAAIVEFLLGGLLVAALRRRAAGLPENGQVRPA